jgi:microcompartment protein CcmK/EutM
MTTTPDPFTRPMRAKLEAVMTDALNRQTADRRRALLDAMLLGRWWVTTDLDERLSPLLLVTVALADADGEPVPVNLCTVPAEAVGMSEDDWVRLADVEAARLKAALG